MNKRTNGGPAFPNCQYNGQGGFDIVGGMSLRDYFAAQAITALEPPGNFLSQENTDKAHVLWARRAYQMADAMLAEREKGGAL